MHQYVIKDRGGCNYQRIFIILYVEVLIIATYTLQLWIRSTSLIDSILHGELFVLAWGHVNDGDNKELL